MNISSAEKFCDDLLHLSDGGKYKRIPPIFQNVEILELKIRNRFLEIWRRDAEYPSIQLYRLKNVQMFDVGYLFKDGFILRESIQHLNETTLDSVKKIIANQLIENAHQTIASESFLLKRNSSSNYGHWLIEFLPFINFYMTEQFKNCHLILEFFSKNPFGGVQLDTMKSFRVEQSKIYRCSRKKYLLSDVWIPSKSCIHSHIKHPQLIQITRGVGLAMAAADAFTKNVPKQSRLFISRRSSHKRRLINEDELKSILYDFGFDFFYPEDFSFTEQVAKFSNADAIVGISGAALTNIVFCKPECKVISLNSDTSQESFFWDIANLVGINFSFVFGKSFMEKDPHSDFFIEPSTLKQALKINLLETTL